VRTISSRHNPVVAAFRALAAAPDPAGAACCSTARISSVKRSTPGSPSR
jgi:hypothetical protein